MPATVPPDKINLKLILVTGKTHEFLFNAETTVGTITQHVFNNWPPGWEEEAVGSSGKLRLIYQGRFLQNDSTLNSLKLPIGKTTVMHLVARENISEHSKDVKAIGKNEESGCCTIL